MATPRTPWSRSPPTKSALRCSRTARPGPGAPTTPAAPASRSASTTSPPCFPPSRPGAPTAPSSPPSGCKRCGARCRPIRRSAADGTTQQQKRPPGRHETGVMTTTKFRIAGVLALALTLGLAACKPPARNATPPAQQAARTVSVVRIEMRPIAGGIVTSGLLTPRNQVAVSPDLTGYRVSKLYVDEGAWVRAGQPLAEMDGSILKAQFDQQSAALAQQKANADQRAREAARVADLDNQGVMAEEAVQQ